MREPKYFDTEWGPVRYVSKRDDSYLIEVDDLIFAQQRYKKEQDRLLKLLQG